MSETQKQVGATSHLTQMLDVVNNNMMQYLIGTTELSHYLTALVDELNLSAKDEDALNAASSVIYELREEVKRLRKQELKDIAKGENGKTKKELTLKEINEYLFE